jgi:hypothetical protein
VDKKQEKGNILDFFKRPKVRLVLWIFVCIFASIFGVTTDRYGMIGAFGIVLAIKILEYKYPEFLE